MTAAAAASRQDLVAELREIWQSIDALLEGLKPDEWQLPTSCPGWTVRDHVAHLVGTESTLAGRPSPPTEEGWEAPAHVLNDIGRFNEAWIESLRDVTPAELLAAWRDIVAVRLSALEAMTDDDFAADSWTPVGPGTYGRFMEIRVFDCWVHEQDIRDAVGRPGHEAGPAAEQALAEITGALGYLVGKRAGAPDGSRVSIELTGSLARTLSVAVDGRARVVDSLEGPATAQVRLPARIFARLACGRIDPGEALASGEIDLRGDTALGDKVVRNLKFTI